MKIGKEIKLTEFKNYNVIIGSVNNKEPQSIYLNISAWGDPQIDNKTSYSRIIRDINKKIKQSIYNHLSSNETYFDKSRTIVDLDIRESGIRFGKRSYINCEITLFLKSEVSISSGLLKPNIDSVLDIVINKNFEKNSSFKFFKKKK